MRRHDLFPSPLLMKRLQGVEAMNRALAQTLVAEAASTPGVQKSNQGGWHSPLDVLSRTDGPFLALRDHIVAGFQEALHQLSQAPDSQARIHGVAWAMVMRAGHYSTPHHHGEAHWSGVYYADVGDPAPEGSRAGCLTFLDPRGPRQTEDRLELLRASYDLRPINGLLVVFPGWLMHHVHPYVGQRPRVSISFNLQVT